MNTNPEITEIKNVVHRTEICFSGMAKSSNSTVNIVGGCQRTELLAQGTRSGKRAIYGELEK